MTEIANDTRYQILPTMASLLRPHQSSRSEAWTRILQPAGASLITLLAVIFVIAYTAIALELPLRINKSASSLLGAGLLWTVQAF